jgi:hypothetical protein
LDEVEEEVEELDELDSEEVEELDELGADELLLLSLLLLLDELSPLGLLSEVPLLSASDVELFTSVFSPLFSDWAPGSLSLLE